MVEHNINRPIDNVKNRKKKEKDYPHKMMYNFSYFYEY